jgi:hypothetical protein
VWPAIVWIVLLTAAFLCYPRRPRSAGTLMILVGAWTLLLKYMNWGNGRVTTGVWTAAWVAVFWLAVGLFWTVKFRDPDVRAAHVDYWTAKS